MAVRENGERLFIHYPKKLKWPRFRFGTEDLVKTYEGCIDSRTVGYGHGLPTDEEVAARGPSLPPWMR